MGGWILCLITFPQQVSPGIEEGERPQRPVGGGGTVRETRCLRIPENPARPALRSMSSGMPSGRRFWKHPETMGEGILEAPR